MLTSVSEELGSNSDNWPSVAIIILNWNNYEDTSRCLQSLASINYPNYQIYVVDNDSKDGSQYRLSQEFNQCRFVFNNENLGFAAGCNRGIEQALNDGYEYILLLNNDTIISDEDFLEHGVKLAESEEEYGVIGGKILLWPDTNRIWSTGGYIKFWSGEHHIGHGEKDQGQYEEIEEREFISGALMLISRDVIDDIGLLPEVYFFGKEEWEFSQQASEAGYKLMYSPKFRVYHEASDSHDHSDPAYVYNGTLSKIIFKRRNLDTGRYLVWIISYWVYVRFFLPLRYYILRERFNQNVDQEELIRAIRCALNDSSNVSKITEYRINKFRENLNE